MKTPQLKINKHALNIFDSVKDFEKFLQEVYGKENDYIRAKGYYPSIDNVAIDGVLYTMDMYDDAGKEITLYNKRTDQQINIINRNRYLTPNGFSDSKVYLFEKYGVYRNDINYLD